MKDENSLVLKIIAHDLINPLHQMIGFSEILDDLIRNTGSKEMITYSSLMNESSHSLHKLLLSLLHWAENNSNEFVIKNEVFNLNELFDEILLTLKPSIYNKALKCVNLNTKTHMMNSDRNMIMIILRNLLSNSVKFTYKGGFISFESKEESGFHIITIKDNGIGMSETQIQNINSSSVESSIGTNKEMGMGLGYTFITCFLNQLNGKLDIESLKGKGTTVRIQIPRIIIKTTGYSHYLYPGYNG